MEDSLTAMLLVTHSIREEYGGVLVGGGAAARLPVNHEEALAPRLDYGRPET